MGKEVEEVMEGYKETEIGMLPVDWDVVNIDHVTIESYSGGTPSTKEEAYWGGSIPWTTTALMGEKEIYLTRYQRLITERALDETSTRLAPKGSLLLGTRVGVGKAVIATFDVAVNQDITVLRLDSQKILPQFLAYSLKIELLQESLRGKVRGTTIKGIPRKDVLTLRIPLPPLPEQCKIAHVLSTIQRTIEMQDKVIAAAQELKKSLMRHLFTYGPVPVDQIDRVPLKETEIGPVPEHWEVVRLGEAITQAQYGLSMRGESTGKYPILRMNNLSDGRVDINSLQYVNLDKNTYSRFRLNKGDILFNRTNSFELVGKTSIFNLSGDYVFASYIIRLVTDDNRLISAFLNYYLNMESTQNRLKLLATRGVSQSNISATKLKGFLIPIPPISEQKQIANFLTLMDQKINVEETRKSTLQSLFQTMLHLLMTGKVRVKDLEVNLDAPGR